MKRLCALFFGLVLISPIVSQLTPPPVLGSDLPAAAQKAVDRGLAAARQEEWELAIKYFSEAQKTAPESPHVLFNLALANDKAGGRELLAAVLYRAFLASAPDASNAGQVKTRIVDLEVKAESITRKLIDRAKKAIPGMIKYLRNSDEPFPIELEKDGKRGKKKTLSEIEKYNECGIAIIYTGGSVNTERSIYCGSTEAKREAYREIRDIIESERDGYMETQKASVYWQLTEALARLGDLEEAEKAAGAVSLKGEYRDWTYHELGMAQARAGDVSGAGKSAGKIKDDERRQAEVYQEIFLAQLRAGDFSGAQKTLANSKIDINFIPLEEIVKTKIDAGDIKGALKTAALSSDEYNKQSQAYAGIAAAQAGSGDLEGAKETASLIQHDFFQSQAYSEIVKAQLKRGDIAGANETAAMIQTDSTRSLAFGEIFKSISPALETRLRDGDPAGARRLADLIQNESSRGQAYHKIVEAQIKVDDIEGAVESVGLIKDPYYKAWDLKEISLAYRGKGQLVKARAALDESLKIARTVENESGRNLSLQEVGRIEAESGNLSRAAEIADGIGNPLSKILVLAAIARAYFKNGNPATARDMIAQAENIASEINEKNDYAWPSICGTISTAKAETGDIAGAVKTASGITDAYQKARSLTAIAAAHFRNNDPGAALAALEQARLSAAGIRYAYNKSDAFNGIALAEIGMNNPAAARNTLVEAVRAASQIEYESLIESYFEKIAETMEKAGDPDGAGKARGLAAALKSKLIEKEVNAGEQPVGEGKPKIPGPRKEEIKSWMSLYGSFSNQPAVADLASYMDALKEEAPDRVVWSLASAANDMAEAINKIRDKEASWEK